MVCMASRIYFTGTRNSLRRIFSIVNSINREAIFKFEEDLITTECHDASKTAYLEMKIRKDYFDEFRMEKKAEIGFNISRVLKVIEMCTGKISVSVNEEISIVSKHQFDIKAYIPQIHIDSGEVIIPKYSYTTSAILRIEHINNVLSNTLEFSDFIEISANKKVEVKASSPYGDRIAIDMSTEPSSNLDHKDRSIVVSTDIIKKILSNFEGRKNVRLNVDESLPTIEILYEDENLYVRSLFSRYTGEE